MSQLDINIHHPIGSFCLDINVGLNLDKIMILYGQSGAGKSTLLRLIAGLTRAHIGLIKYNKAIWQRNNDIFIPVEQRRIGYIFQHDNLFPHLNVKDNLLFGFKRINLARPHFIPDTVIETLNLSPLLSRQVQNLSGGEKQRVALAQAILSHPQLLLLDEPINALDDDSKYDIMNYLKLIREEFDLPMLYVTHSRVESEYLSESIIRIDNGHITEYGLAPKTMSVA